MFREGYLYRFAQGPALATRQAAPRGLTPEALREWAQGWSAADKDLAQGIPARFPLPPPAPAPDEEPEPDPLVAPRPPPDPEPEPEPPPKPRRAPQVVKAKPKPRPPTPAPPAPPTAPSEPPPTPRSPLPEPPRPPAWLVLRVHRDEGGYRVESEGSDVEVPGASLSTLLASLAVHLRVRLGPDDGEPIR
jgi:hypothetical protein